MMMQFEWAFQHDKQLRIEEMIPTLAVHSQWLSHMWTWKISGVYNRIRIHDLCDASVMFLPTEL